MLKPTYDPINNPIKINTDDQSAVLIKLVKSLQEENAALKKVNLELTKSLQQLTTAQSSPTESPKPIPAQSKPNMFKP